MQTISQTYLFFRIKDILPEVDPNALKTYNELYSSVIPNKIINIADFPYTLKKLIEENEKTIEDFEEVCSVDCIYSYF